MSSHTLPGASLMTPVVAAINHLLASEAWARQALLPHAGKLALIDVGAITLRLRVGRDGLVEAGDTDAPVEVGIHLKLADLPLMARNPERAFSYVRIDGDAEFANTISQLSRGLRWDAAADLERLIGPIAAHRLANGARDTAAALRDAGRKFGENVAEYLLEEKSLLVRPLALDDMKTEVSRLRDDVERADKRLAKLAQRISPAISPTIAPSFAPAIAAAIAPTTATAETGDATTSRAGGQHSLDL